LFVAMVLISLPPTNILAINTPRRAGLWYCGYGFFCGLGFCILSMIFADVFGRKALGRVNGVITAVHTSTAGVGPLVFGWSRDTTGAYRTATTACLAVFLVATLILALRSLPVRTSRLTGKQSIE
jgi:nitrate/nitrite transporter NarK